MRIMVLGATKSASELAMTLAENREVTPICMGAGEELPGLEQQLENATSTGGFLLQGGPESVEQAVELDSLLDGLGSALDLVIVIDTALESPDDFCPWNEAPVVEGSTYPAQPRSVVLLLAATRR